MSSLGHPRSILGREHDDPHDEGERLRDGEVVMGWLWHTRANLLQRDTNRKLALRNEALESCWPTLA